LAGFSAKIGPAGPILGGTDFGVTGPPFTIEEIKRYMEENGINHRRITPLWPQANSEAENFMKHLSKTLCSAHAKGKMEETSLQVYCQLSDNSSLHH